MAITAGDNLNSVPSTRKQTFATNYLDLASGSTDWGQQYVPDLMREEAEVFGPRTISGFLSQVGAEEAMQADQVVWSEQSRLHLSYLGHIEDNNATGGGDITIEADIDGNNDDIANHGIRVNDTVIVANSEAVCKAIVIDLPSSGVITVSPYGYIDLVTAGFTTENGVRDTTILVYGSEYGKATGYYTNNAASTEAESRGANEPKFKSFSNKPIIMKDFYEVSGSDVSRIGWVEVSNEMGESGYMWYLKAEGETRARFVDYIEMAMLEGEKHSDTDNPSGGTVELLVDSFLRSDGDTFGTEGLFQAIEKRGNVTTGVSGVNAATDLAEFDAILAEFDKQGAIEEYMMFVNRATSLAMDDMLASMNSYGAGGTSYGVFDNDEDMALNLGFSGFRRGSYDFYKSDFRYLNDKATRGGINDAAGANAIRGVMVPAGMSTVYDQMVGSNMKRPFLHVRYRASETDDRRMKSWVTGSVGAATTALDAMRIHMLTERCLITQGANNFMLMK